MKRAIAVVALLAALFTGYLAYLGYFGGAVFVPVAATASPPANERGVAAVLLSGDMGFNTGMGPKVAERLAAHGIPVTGVNSLTYFRTRRSPLENEKLIAGALRRALAQPGIARVVLIGQSFGADMLHAGLPALPPALRAKVMLVVLVVPGDTIDFRASPSELFSFEPPDAPAMKTAASLDWVPVLCVQGAAETDSLCPLLTLSNVTRIALPGGHPLHRDVDALYAVIARAVATAAGDMTKS